MLAFIMISVAALLVAYKSVASKSKLEFTEWEHLRDTIPLVTTLPNGKRVFQSQAYGVRFNNRTQKWEATIVTDPVQRPFSDATSLADVYHLRFY
jgi:hypothetical protein